MTPAESVVARVLAEHRWKSMAFRAHVAADIARTTPEEDR